METLLDKVIDKFMIQNGVVYELRAVNSDGEVMAKYTSHIDASDVAGYAGLLDEEIMKMAIDDKDALEEAKAEDQLQEALDNE